MLKNLLKLTLFGLCCFLLVEFSYRFYVAGPLAFSPELTRTNNKLIQTNLIQPAAQPDIFYELKPDLDTWFRGYRFRTNSAGLPDREYSRTKPEGVFRIAVVGSSWTMGTAVRREDVYHEQLEAWLNERYAPQRFEVISFGVEMYGLREIVGTLRHKVPAWEPDMILIAITSYTGFLLWEEPSADEQLPPVSDPFYQSWALRALAKNLGIRGFGARLAQRPIVGGDTDLFDSQVIRAMREVDAIADQLGIPAAVMWLSFGSPGPALEPAMVRESAALGLGFMQIYQALSGKGDVLIGMQVSKADSHPNAAAHAIIAEQVLQELENGNYIPVLNER